MTMWKVPAYVAVEAKTAEEAYALVDHGVMDASEILCATDFLHNDGKPIPVCDWRDGDYSNPDDCDTDAVEYIEPYWYCSVHAKRIHAYENMAKVRLGDLPIIDPNAFPIDDVW